MLDQPPPIDAAQERRITRWFLAAVVLVGVIYVCFDLTPSSYGVFLNSIQAMDAGPVIGSSRLIRSDEWSVATPLFQAAVRNKFQRINETSFYREDLRNFVALPLKDWSLIFKPQFWAFFVLPPDIAYSIYYAFFLIAFLAGYHLFFRQLGVTAWLAMAASVILYFSGFTQFWWTSTGPLLATLPWVLIVALRPMAWSKKVLLCAWLFPAFVLAVSYPILLLTLGWGALIVILAFRPSLLRSPGEFAAIALGIVATVVVGAVYFADVLPVMRNTVYPGHRISPPGETPVAAALSEVLPYVSFKLGDYQHLTGENICEIGAAGSFFPLLTLCLLRFRSLRDNMAARKALAVLLTGFAVITLWEIAPVPTWIGHMLLWDRGGSQRWLFTSGFLLTLAALVIWKNRLIEVTPARIAMFLVLGPLLSLAIKVAWLIHSGEGASQAISECALDMFLAGLACAAVIGTSALAERFRPLLPVFAVVLINVYAFGRFNPLQPAAPIFDVPETDVVHALREVAAASPGGVLTSYQSMGATRNGMGFRSVAHVLMSPQIELFRAYFPAMDAGRFNNMFNRFAHIHVTPTRVPVSPRPDVIEVPMEAFVAIRNVRKVSTGGVEAGSCAQTAAGGVDRVTSRDGALIIEGWAPWKAETDQQGIRVFSARTLRAGSLATITRPDLAERLQDYGYVKAGFRLQVDGKALRPEEIVLFATGTAQGDVRLSCCGCPK